MAAPAIWLTCQALASLTALTSPDPVVAAVAGLAALVVLPGMALADWLPWADDGPELGALALASGVVGTIWLVVAALLLVLAGLAPGHPLLGLSGVVAVGSPLLRRRLPLAGFGRAHGGEVLGLVVVLAVALPLRLVGLSYSEFQGDETEVVLSSLAVVQRLPDALFYHGKGPAELLVVSTLYDLVGHLTEGSARLPFALFNVLAIIGLTTLVGRWFGRSAGFVCGLLLAVNGYFVAFGRIAQYQSLVLLLSVGAISAAQRFRDSLQGGWAIWAGLLTGVGLLAHYDALFAGAFVALLIADGLGRDRHRWRVAIPPLGLAAAVGVGVALLFFGPDAISPLRELTTSRVVGRVGDVFPRNNLPDILPGASLYLSPLYAVGLVVLAAIGLLIGLTRSSKRGLVVSVALWAALPLLVYVAVVRKPGTHIHVGLEGLSVLAALAIAALVSGPTSRAWRGVAWGVLLAGLAAVLWYQHAIFLTTQPEAVRTGQVAHHRLFWSPNGLLPRKERFGFPYQAGWKAVGVLFADRVLHGSYDSNENPQITHWYTRDAWRCTADPRYYLIADSVQDEIEPPRKRIASDYRPILDITVHGVPKLHVYDLHPDGSPTVQVVAAEDLAPRFDGFLSAPDVDPGVWGRGAVSPRLEPVGANFGAARLLGYRLYAEDPRPGGVLRLDLYWQPSVRTTGQAPVVHLGRETLVADGSGPGCDHSDSWATWQAGRPFVQRHSLPISETAAPGTYPLLVSLEGAGRQSPLPILDGPGAGASMVELTRVEIR